MAAEALRWRVVTVAVALASPGWLPAPGAAQPADRDVRDTTEVAATVHAFHGALAAGDSARALELLHPEVRVFEGGHAESLSQYRSGHLAADMEFSASVDREILSENVTGSEDRALYLSEYRMSGTYRGEEVEARGTETMVLVRTRDGWRIRHIHWSSQ